LYGGIWWGRPTVGRLQTLCNKHTSGNLFDWLSDNVFESFHTKKPVLCVLHITLSGAAEVKSLSAINTYGAWYVKFPVYVTRYSFINFILYLKMSAHMKMRRK
jgi:hypothetical protein